MLVLDIFTTPITILALSKGLPFKKLIGANMSWFMDSAIVYRKMKQSLGSFFMTYYRVLCMKRPGMKSIRRKEIINQLFWLEGIITVFLLGYVNVGWTLR